MNEIFSKYFIIEASARSKSISLAGKLCLFSAAMTWQKGTLDQCYKIFLPLCLDEEN